MRNNQLLKRRLFGLGIFATAAVVAVTFKLSGFSTFPQAVVAEPVVLETAAAEVTDGLNRLFPFLNGTVFDSIPFRQANRTVSETNSDGDAFPDWQVYDFGTPEDDGYGGIVKIYDEGSVLKYVLENFQTPSETWNGWLASPDTDNFPSGSYKWDWSVQTTETKRWQGDVMVSQQSEEQFLIQGTLQALGTQGNFQLIISETNPLVVDAVQPALLVGGQGAFIFTDPNGSVKQGVWNFVDVGISRLWLDENANGQVDSGEMADITYDSQTGTWQATITQQSP